ncbi:uncharacterized protein LOC143583752 [Bidens hawaiensis]|uniref:uncharacterized protein LOC143583752 n=1 Tax=Bidens hawaiensis TaxID=980011 RepID=UPI00404A4D47
MFLQAIKIKPFYNGSSYGTPHLQLWVATVKKMNRDWMYKASHTSEIYAAGVQSFLSAAEANRAFQYFEDVTEIEAHLFENDFMPRYDCLSRHGESLADFSTSSTANEGTYNNDASNLNSTYNNDSSNLDENDGHLNGPSDNLNEMLHDMETNTGDAEIENLQHLFEDEEKVLYTGSRINKLDAVLNLSNLKSKNGWSDKSFTELLVFLHDRMLSEVNELPISTYRAKKLMCPMGLEVERIHVCPNNCILYRKRYENEHKCVVCGASRYKQKKDSDEVDDDEVAKKRPPAKMLWYLLIIPRLKRLFSNEKEAKLLRWHSDERIIDGKLRHVADSPQWRTIDNKYPEFGKETRNIWFGLSSDGFNPFGGMSSIYSTWPVFLCIYNLPPWLCMKRKYIMMSLLIQGPRQPGNNIDVYLSPLIDDLKTLWDSDVNIYDAYGKEHFQLHAMIFCTINDFPAYGNLSGYTTKGKKACQVIDVEQLDKWQKDVYVTLCELEMYFSPSFFDIMVHLISHIVQEIKACGPVFLRYMYPFKRYMSVLKGYVRNRHRPEGSIIEGYTSEEVIEFCQGYVEGLDSVGIPKTRYSGRLDGHGGAGFKTFSPGHELLHDAHLVVLKHITCLAPYVNEHMQMLRLTHPGKDDIWYIKTQNKELSKWMKRKVKEIDVDETVKRLGQGPDFIVDTYQGYDINGYTFYTRDQDNKSAVQNSGVTIIASTT